jgi:alanine racemase
VVAFPQAYYNTVRPGLIIYGLYPAAAMRGQIDLKPCMTFRTQIVHLKQVPAGTAISYNNTFTTSKDTRVATLPVGYADGYDRLLSGCGFVSIKGQKAPVLGRVCMDMLMVDVTSIKGVSAGDEVVLFGSSPTIHEMAQTIGTINYEIVCKVGKRVPRLYT